MFWVLDSCRYLLSSLTADAFHGQLLSFTAHQELTGEVLAGRHAVQLARRALAGMPVVLP